MAKRNEFPFKNARRITIREVVAATRAVKRQFGKHLDQDNSEDKDEKQAEMKLKDVTETLKKDLQDPEFIRGYLQDAIHDGFLSFLIALRDVAKANIKLW